MISTQTDIISINLYLQTLVTLNWPNWLEYKKEIQLHAAHIHTLNSLTAANSNASCFLICAEYPLPSIALVLKQLYSMRSCLIMNWNYHFSHQKLKAWAKKKIYNSIRSQYLGGQQAVKLNTRLCVKSWLTKPQTGRFGQVKTTT